MISISDTEFIHNILIEQFGGATGIRELGSLDAAIARPFQTFDGNELYPSATEKASAVIESVLINHPFVDGNKRSGYVLMRLLLMKYGFDIIATEDEKYNFVVDVASGTKGYDEILQWLTANTVSLHDK